MSIRQELGDFNSIVCFKALITGIEDTLGQDGATVVFIRAGKVRGQALAQSLGLSGKNIPIPDIAPTLNKALGQEGTKLCLVKKASESAGVVSVETAETVCSAGEPAGAKRRCTFTLGAVWGALETITGKIYEGRHTESVLDGKPSDKFVFTPA